VQKRWSYWNLITALITISLLILHKKRAVRITLRAMCLEGLSGVTAENLPHTIESLLGEWRNVLDWISAILADYLSSLPVQFSFGRL
jgi:hypothetical protein